MESVFVIMLMNVIMSALFGVPVIYCIVRLAGFRSRNRLIWGILAILASIPFSGIFYKFSARPVISGVEVLSSVPIFVILALLPSLRAPADQKSCSVQFTKNNDKYGYISVAAFVIVLLGLFYFRLYSKPLVPALQNGFLHVHVPLGFIAYALIFAAFVLSIVRLGGNHIPRAIVGFQLLAVSLFYVSVMSGALWANVAWGAYWTWDPKETWSLIMLFVMVAITTYVIRVTPGKVKLLLSSALQTLVALFVLLIMPLLLSGLHVYSIYSSH